jgi:4a-hydroxytetrahydrobiopterin dehydratase
METPPGWSREGETITRTFEHKDFNEALAFVNAVGNLAEAANHHPDIDIRWNKVTLALTTHSANALTDKDTQLATQINDLVH